MIKEYDIWKVVGRYGTRYYESEKQFLKYGLPKTRSKIYKCQAYRFTSGGWQEVISD